MSNFKIGDWVKSKYKTVKVKSFITLDKIDYIQDSENGLMPVWQAELWRPKEGEWCWFYDVGMQTPQLHQFQCFSENEQLNYGEKFVEKGQERDSWGYDYCEPFIGELPSFIKDKQ